MVPARHKFTVPRSGPSPFLLKLSAAINPVGGVGPEPSPRCALEHGDPVKIFRKSRSGGKDAKKKRTYSRRPRERGRNEPDNIHGGVGKFPDRGDKK